MKSYRRILLVADPLMRRTPAFEQAVALARASAATLHMALFDRDPAITGVSLLEGDWAEEARERWAGERRSWLEQEAAALAACGIAASIEFVWARPGLDDVLSSVNRHAPDLVIVDRQGQGRLERLGRAPIDLQLLRQCPAPMLLVNSAAHLTPRRILAAVDTGDAAAATSGLNDRILTEAIAMATRCDAEMDIVQVILDATASDAASEKAFNALADGHGIAVKRRHLLRGKPAEVIADLARADRSDIVVIGAARRTFRERAVGASVATGLFDRVPCNLLAVGI